MFFGDDDDALYRDLLADRCRKAGVARWAYGLMPNPMHLILVKRHGDGVARALGRRIAATLASSTPVRGRPGTCSSRVSARSLWMRRIVSLRRAPSRSTLFVRRAADRPWSSARAHLAGKDDRLVTVAPLPERVEAIAGLVTTDADDPASGAYRALRAAETIGRRLGDAACADRIERRLDRTLRPAKRGPKPSRQNVER